MPVLDTAFSGTLASPKRYPTSVAVAVDSASIFQHAVVQGDLVLTGTLPAGFTVSGVRVEGNLDLSQLQGDSVTLLEQIVVSGDVHL